MLLEIEAERTYSAEVRIKAIGLLREISQPAFMFIAHFVKKVLMLLDGPNRLLQSEDMDLLTGLQLVVSATECVSKLRCEAEFTELWDTVTDSDVTPAPSKWQRTANKNLYQYLVEETTGQKDNDKTELLRLYFLHLTCFLQKSTIASVSAISDCSEPRERSIFGSQVS